MNKKVIYTAIFGDDYGLVPQPKIKGYDYICFTDNPKISAYPWIIKLVNAPDELDNTRKNRYYKILPHRFLKDYDISIYIDSNFLIIKDPTPLIDTYLKDSNFACFNHNATDSDPRDCIYQEHKAILELNNKGIFRASSTLMEQQINLYRKEGYPEHNGLIKGGCLLRRHTEPDIVKNMEEWWGVIQKYSKRDQLSFNYIAWKNHLKFNYIPGDIRRGNPYVYYLGKNRKNWTKKVIKTKIKLFLKSLIK